MTMPLSPNTTYVAMSTPSVKANDLNDLQNYLSGLYSGIYSIAGAVLDGTGGAGPAAHLPTSALLQTRATDGTCRSNTDYLGFRTGPVVETIDSFMGVTAAVIGARSAVFIGGAAGWTVTSTANTVTGKGGVLGSGGAFPGGTLRAGFSTGRAGGNSIILSTGLFYNVFSGTTYVGVDVSVTSKIVTVIEWAFVAGQAGVSNTNLDWFMGLGADAATNPLTTAGYMTAALRFAPSNNSDATMKLVTGDGTTQNVVDTGIAPVVNTRYRVRMEIHRSGSALGSDLVRLYIAAGTSPAVVVSSALNLPLNASVPLDLLWKAFLDSTSNPGTVAEIDFGYWKMFAQPHGPLAAGALTSDV